MAAAPQPRPDLDPIDARDRVGAALRRAWEGAENAPLEDETQRLMLHLSIEPLEPQAAGSRLELHTAQRRRSLVRRLLGRPHRRARA
jgi:hypothetical protein